METETTVLALSSSPRRHGNSELLLQSFIRGVQTGGLLVDTIRISDLNFSPCRACEQCAATGECVLKDDMRTVYPRVASARALIIATPIYFGTLSAQLKMFIDRFQCWWYAKYRLNRPQVQLEQKRLGFFISASALDNKNYPENALLITKIFFNCINFHLAGSLLCTGLDEKGAVKKDPLLLQNAYEAGCAFAEKVFSVSEKGPL